MKIRAIYRFANGAVDSLELENKIVPHVLTLNVPLAPEEQMAFFFVHCDTLPSGTQVYEEIPLAEVRKIMGEYR